MDSLVKIEMSLPITTPLPGGPPPPLVTDTLLVKPSAVHPGAGVGGVVAVPAALLDIVRSEAVPECRGMPPVGLTVEATEVPVMASIAVGSVPTLLAGRRTTIERGPAPARPHVPEPPSINTAF